MDELKGQPPCPRFIVLEGRIAELQPIGAAQTKQIAEQTKQIAALRECLSQNSSK